jgi:uracil-DNA glycosylase family 4
MPWSERQISMLEVMGVRIWTPPIRANAQQGRAALASSAEAISTSAPDASPSHRVQGIDLELVRPDLRSVPAVNALDWTDLRAAVVNCVACKLCESRRQTVFGVGHPRAHWMIVGEAPGEQEDRQGEPFVGKSGQLLDNMLRAVSLTRAQAPASEQVYIANTLKCRPPGNRNPTPEELAKCEPFLIRQLQLVQPKIILAMGRFAVQSLLRSDEPIGRLRGRVHQYRGVALIVTYHPAYLLRNPEDKAKAWEDLCLAVQTVRAQAAV